MSTKEALDLVIRVCETAQQQGVIKDLRSAATVLQAIQQLSKAVYQEARENEMNKVEDDSGGNNI